MSPAGLPSWPAGPVAHGAVVLRELTERDVPMAVELAADPYVPLLNGLAARASEQEARDWIKSQRDRLAEGAGLPFAIAEADSGRAVGEIVLGLRQLAQGRASAGYAVIPGARGRGLAAAALTALTTFAWTIPALHRIELYIEPWNLSSIKTAERSGYQREGLLRSYQEIGGQRRDMLLYACLRPVPPSDDGHR